MNQASLTQSPFSDVAESLGRDVSPEKGALFGLSTETPIPMEAGFRPSEWYLHANAVGPDGKILLAVSEPSNWFWPRLY